MSVYLAIGLYLLPLVVVMIMAVRQTRVTRRPGRPRSGSLPGPRPRAATEVAVDAPAALPSPYPDIARPRSTAPVGLSVARLVAVGDPDRLVLVDVIGQQPGPAAVEDEATCSCPEALHDSVPARTGRCGFGALRRRAQAEELLDARRAVQPDDASVLLYVELSGRVLSSVRGFRAQRRRVLGVEVLPLCVLCLRRRRAVPADVLAARTAVPVPSAAPGVGATGNDLAGTETAGTETGTDLARTETAGTETAGTETAGTDADTSGTAASGTAAALLRPARPLCLDHALAGQGEVSWSLERAAALLGLPPGSLGWMRGRHVEATRVATLGDQDSRRGRG